MPSYFVMLLVVGGVVVLVFKAVALRREWRARMAHLASTRGWRLIGSTWSAPRVEGEAFGCRVVVSMPWRVPDRHDRQPSLAEQLTRRSRTHAWAYTRLQVTFPRTMALRFAPESGRLGRLLTKADLVLGDPSFDDTVRVGGQESELRARFDGPTRWAVRLLVERGGHCDGGGIELAWQHDRSISRDADGIDCALEVLGRLRGSEGTTRERLAAVAGDDPKPGVRLGALRCLLERHRSAAETAATLRGALEDADPALRLLAARTTGDLAVLEALLPPGHPPDVRLGAVEALAEHDAGLAILRRVIARLDGRARAAAIEALKAHGGVAVGGLAIAETEGGGLALADGAD